MNMPAAGEGKLKFLDRPKKPVSKSHYEHYCAGVFAPVEAVAVTAEDMTAINKRAYEAGTMTSDQYHKVKEHLGSVLATKYRTCRRAFRMYDENCSGSIDRTEVRKLFQYHGYNQTAADRFFNHMDSGQDGIIEFNEFIDVFAPYIQPVDDLPDYKDVQSTMQLYHNEIVLNENKSEEEQAKFDPDLHDGIIGNVAVHGTGGAIIVPSREA